MTDLKQVRGYQILDTIGAKALGDDDYRRQLLADPKTVLRKEGLTVAADVDVVVHENTAKSIHLALPAHPAQADLLDANSVDLVHLIYHHPF